LQIGNCRLESCIEHSADRQTKSQIADLQSAIALPYSRLSL
jgi:hypothetical protein